MALTLITLGTASLLFNEQPLDAQFGLKARALLFYTALQGHAVPREQLAAMFWKESPQERANASLRMALMSLRERLGEAAHITRTEVEIVGWSDINTFHEQLGALSPAMSGIQPWGENLIQPLEAALQLYKGPFLHNFSPPDAEAFDLWAQATREAVRRQFFKAAAALMSLYEKTERSAEGLEWGAHLLRIDPLHEPTYRALMRLYAQRGERVLAIREFETCKKLLASELNVEPEQETLALYEQLVGGSVTVVTPQAPIPPKRPIPHNLPGQLTPLIGRIAELRDLTRLFDEARLITIVGTGGIGKTRLAVEFGSRQVAETAYPDGVFFVDLSSIQYPSQVAEAVADGFDILESPQVSLSTQISRHLKPKSLLLILDNFEHVLEAADQIEEWLKAAPRIAVLVTSREPLQLYAEYLYTVPSLPDADAQNLFVRRVSAVRSGFVVTQDNAGLIQDICTRLEGLPLALELAASHAQTLSLDQILHGLDDSLTFLRSQRRGGLERQRTIYGAIEWSYQLLTHAEQALYRLASVFVGGWTREAVEALGGELAQHLQALVSKHLIQAIDDGQRFRMLESIREHARQKLADHEETFLFSEAHLHYFASLAERGSRGMRSSEQALWFRRLEAERDNFRAALLFADEHPTLSETLCQLVAGLGYFYYVRGYIREGREWIDKALEKQQDLPARIRAELFASAGHVVHGYSEYDLADRYHQTALEIYRALGDGVNAAFMMSNLSMRERDEERGLVLMEEAYRFAQRARDDFVLLNAANNYGVSLERLGHMEQAKQVFEDIIEEGAHLRNETLRPFIILNLASIYRDIGLQERAAEMFELIIPQLRTSYVQIAFPNVMEEIGDFYYSIGSIPRAIACYDEAFATAEAIASDTAIRRLYRARAMIAGDQNQTSEMKAAYALAFQGSMEAHTNENWPSFMMGIFYIAERLALKSQIEISIILLRALLHHISLRKTRLNAPHEYLKTRCFQALRRCLSEAQLQEALQEAVYLSEGEMFAEALAALDLL